jgi:hypothetical protein
LQSNSLPVLFAAFLRRMAHAVNAAHEIADGLADSDSPVRGSCQRRDIAGIRERLARKFIEKSRR